MTRFSLILAFTVLLISATTAVQADKARLDLGALANAPIDAEIVVSGHNASTGPAVIVLRVDDGGSADYWSRVNLERRVPPGRFIFRVPVADLRTPRGRPVNRLDLDKAFLFATDTSVSFEHVFVDSPSPLVSSKGSVLALDFGPAEAPVFPGFSPISPGDPRLHGQSFVARSRPGPDSLIGDGIEGVEQLTLSPGEGRWRVVLWTEDPGEWEYLPHAREKRIRVNGRTVLERRLSPEDWIRQEYLAGRDREWQPHDSPWSTFGQRRGGRIETVVDAPEGRILVEFAGSDRSTTFVSGVLVIPEADPAVAEQVATLRKERFDATWRVAHLSQDGPAVTVSPASTIVTGPGAPAILTVTLRSGITVDAPDVVLTPPQSGTRALTAWTLVGHWRLTRPDTAATLLIPDDRHLRGDGLSLPLVVGLPRRYTIVVIVSAGTPAGSYRGSLSVDGQTVPFEVEVLDVNLPAADASVGVYLEDLPTHRWFRTDPTASRVCAMTTLRLFGLTGIAPPLATPDRQEGSQQLLDDALVAASLGFQTPMLAYTPLKRLRDKAQLAEIDRQLSALGVPLFWSAADEVSNHGADLDAFRQELEALRQQAPRILLAGHLNARRDSEIAPSFDAVFVNSGYGLTTERLAELRRSVRHVSLYNLGHPRLAAGAYLWRVDLDGYVQWHARMPTADPFDPTDGREADVALLPPTAGACPAVPDVDRDLIAMAEGITDLRWLRWLDVQASQNATAEALRDAIRRQVTGDWSHDKNLDYQGLQAIREQIIGLAHQLRSKG